jgi:hypothetical protein
MQKQQEKNRRSISSSSSSFSFFSSATPVSDFFIIDDDDNNNNKIQTPDDDEAEQQDICPQCSRRMDLAPTIDGASNEYVCGFGCGIAVPIKDPYVGADAYGRSPLSNLVYGKIGTNMATRNADGTSDDYALKGDNGKYKQPVIRFTRGWTLLSVVEPDYRVRKMKERFSHNALKSGRDEIEISNSAAPVMKQVRKLLEEEKYGLVEKEAMNSSQLYEAYDPILFGGDKRLKDWLGAVSESLLLVSSRPSYPVNEVK